MPPEGPGPAPVPLDPVLRRVARGDLCSGCGACAALAPGRIAMGYSPEGFLRPRQSAPLQAGEAEAIAAVCPGLGQTVEAAGRRDDPLWGPYLQMWTGHALDDRLRHAGASGGGLSAIAAHLLASGQVDGILQIAAAPDRPVGNANVLSRDIEGVLSAAGSRYAPASPLEGLGQRIEPGLRYAFVGKPCDVAALQAMRARDPDLARAIPVTLSFFCAGTPSLAGAGAVLEALGVAEADLSGFRYRGNGWPGQAEARLKDGSRRGMSYHDSWGKILSRHVQNRCRICADGTGVAADLVCADAWEADAQGYPLFQEAPGTSLIVARSPEGQRLLQEAAAAGAVEVAPFDAAGLALIQPGQRERRRGLLARLAALRLMGFAIPRYRGLKLIAAARQGGLVRSAKNFMGMLRRARRRARRDNF